MNKIPTVFKLYCVLSPKNDPSLYLIAYLLNVSPLRNRDALVGKLQRSLPRSFGFCLISAPLRRVGLMSHLSRAQCGKWTEFAKLGDPWGVGGFSTDILVAPVRGSSTGVRTNTIEGVKSEGGWRPTRGPSQVLGKKSSPRSLRSSLPIPEWTAVLGSRILLVEKFNRDIKERLCDIRRGRWDQFLKCGF